MLKSVYCRCICMVLALLMIATPLAANIPTGCVLVLLGQEKSADASQGTCADGKLDGERDAQGNPAWLLFGVGCGVIGVVVAAVYSPDIPSATAVQLSENKSQEYFMCYVDGYEKKSKNKNLMWSAIGWLISIPITLAILYSGE